MSTKKKKKSPPNILVRALSRVWNALWGYAAVGLLRLIAPLPLPVIRAIGKVLGHAFYAFALARRHIIVVNLKLCFPGMAATERKALARANCVALAQSFIDRAWLWHARPDVVRQRLRVTGAVGELQDDMPLILFAPHFVGLDAAATALSQQVVPPSRHCVDIYSPQSNPMVDEWVHAGRRRFGHIDLFTRQDGLKPIVAAIRSGGIFFLPADMDYGRKQSIFVPFYGVQAATAPSLPRFARLGRAKVVPVIARITPAGYDVQVYPAWADYPTGDEEADTLFMNRWLEGVIPAMPEQYFWMHRRFKTRPRGEKKVY